MKLAVIGLGGIAEKGYLPYICGLENIELFFHSRTLTRVDELRKRYRVQDGSDKFSDVIKWKPDASLVLTPTETHFAIAMELMKEGVDVYLEKPMTFDSNLDRQMAEEADHTQRILMVGYNRRYSPLTVQARALWDSRTIGMGVMVKHRSSNIFHGLALHINEEFVHVIDTMRFLCGEGKVITTQYRLAPDGLLIEAVSLVQLETGGFVTLQTCLEGGLWKETYSLHGGKASLDLEMFSELRWYEGGEAKSWREPYDSSWRSNLKGRGFIDEIDHFLTCVKTRSQPSCNGWEALKTQLLAEDIIQAGRLP
jgi:virulence factor